MKRLLEYIQITAFLIEIKTLITEKLKYSQQTIPYCGYYEFDQPCCQIFFRDLLTPFPGQDLKKK